MSDKAIQDILYARSQHGQYTTGHPDETPTPDPAGMILNGHHESAFILLAGDVGEAAITIESDHFRDVLVQVAATALAMIEGLDAEEAL